MNRRNLLQLLSVAVPSLAGLSASQVVALENAASTSRRLNGPLFDPQQWKLVDQLSEIIIPATDTPGAHAAGVAAFMERIVADWYHADERVAFLAGLNDVNTRSKRLFGMPFPDGSSGQQGMVVEQLEDEARYFSGTAPATFWGRFKALTVYGYYTSQQGVEDELRTPFMPGFYDGDAPVGGTANGRH